MTMQTYSIPCGKKLIPIQTPDHVPVQWVESRRLETTSDVKGAVEDALRHPIGSKQLRDLVKPGQKVALVVTDITRKLPEEIIVSLLLKECQSGGIAKTDITAVVATGTHRPDTPQELREKFGDVVNEISFINHDAYNSADLVGLGHSPGGLPLIFNRTVAQADVRISTGVIETHLLAGYSGGVKSIAVGGAGEKTIGATHNFEMIQQTRLGITEGNKFRQFLTEATQALGLHFVVNVVQTGNKEVVKVVTGNPVQAFHEGVKM